MEARNPPMEPDQNSPPAARLSSAAVWSLVLGILSLGCLWLLGSIPAIILGIVALRTINDPAVERRGRGLAITGIVTGSVGVFTGIFGLGIIAGLMFPAFSGALGKAEDARAENTAHNLKNALSAYVTEYRSFPVEGEAGDMTIDSDEALMGILLASDKEASPGGKNVRRIVFYTDKAAKPAGEGKFRRGIALDAEGGGALWDPWGNHYLIRLDTDNNQRIENPQTPGTHLPESIIIWSAGKDGDFETWDDNLKTW